MGDPARADTSRVPISNLTRLWHAAQTLDRLSIRSPDPSPVRRLWGVYDLAILDLRSGADFNERHIPDSASLPLPELSSRIYELPPKWKTLFLVADEPRQARDSAGDLRERGWSQVVAVNDAVSKWTGPWEQGPPRNFLWEPAPSDAEAGTCAILQGRAR